MDQSAGPGNNASTAPSKNWFKNNFGKVIIITLVIIVLGEIIWGARAFLSPKKVMVADPIIRVINNPKPAELSLSTDKASVKVGETVTVPVKISTGGEKTDSTDLVVKYDPIFLSAKEENFATVGKIYSEYPAKQIDTKLGLIGISGITLPGQEGFSGEDTFATLSFTALSPGTTEVKVDFTEGSTADSNIVLEGSAQDILKKVTNAQIKITP